MKKKYIVALIGAGGLILAAIITGIFVLINTIIGKGKTTESQPIKIETTQTVSTPNIIAKEETINTHTVLPNPQKPIPKSVFEHN